MTSRFFVFAMILSIVCVSGSAHAQLLTFQFKGKLPPGSVRTHTEVEDGETYIATFVVDSSIPDSDSSPTVGWYGGSVILGTLEFSGGYSSSVNFNGIAVQVSNDRPDPSGTVTYDGVVVRHPSATGPELIQIATIAESFDALPSDSFPESCTFVRSIPVETTRNWIQLAYRDSNGFISHSGIAAHNTTLTVSGGANTWNNSTVGFFDDNSNWFDGSAPGPGEGASFALSDVYDVEWDALTGSVTNRNLCVTNGNALFHSIGGSTYDYTLTGNAIIDGATLFVGLGMNSHRLNVYQDLFVDDGQLNIGGTTASSSLDVDGDIRLGMTEGFHSELSVSNSDLAADSMRVGDRASANATLDVGTVCNLRSLLIGYYGEANGSMTIDDATLNSEFFVSVADRGAGNLTVRNGGRVVCHNAVVGNRDGGSGSVIVENSGSEFVVDTALDLANFSAGSNGIVLVRDGARILAAEVTLGNSGSSMLTVDGVGSTMQTLDEINVGGTPFNTNILTINDGGAVTCTDLINISDDLFITGTGGTLSAGGEIVLRGDMHLTGSAPDIVGDLNIYNGSVLTSDGAFTYFLGDVQHEGAEISTDSLCESRFIGNYSGSGPLTGFGFVVFEADVQPGELGGPDTTALVSCQSNVAFESTASLSIELGGTTTGDYDSLYLEGNVELDGLLGVSSLGGFVPDYGDSFVIVQIDGVQTGQFTGLSEGQLVTTIGDIDLFITYTAGDGNDVALVNSVEVVVPGDFDVTRGDHLTGAETELAESDNMDFTMRRSTTDVQAVAQVELKTNSPYPTPSRIRIVLESSVFARTAVNQSIELFNFVTSSWESIDSRPATRFTDSTVTLLIAGDPERFVESGSQCMRARVTYQSENPRQLFSASIDRFNWVVSE